MSQWLRQGTVRVITFGPFLSSSDGKTLQTGAGIITSIDHATTGILLSKDGGAAAIREQGANFVASAYDAHGFFKVNLSAVDTNTLGTLMVMHSEPATYLSVWRVFLVVPAQVWDSFFGTDKLDVAVVEEANIDFQALKKASLNAATPASVQNIPATGSGFTALGDTRIAALDVAVSTRAPEALGNLAAIKADVEHATYGLNALLTAIGTRMATFTYTAPDSASTIATAVWGAATRTLTGFGNLVADAAAAVWASLTRSLTDKAGFTISGTKQTLDALQDLSQAGAQAGATAALNAYDPPTKTELDSGLSPLALEATLTAMKGAGWTTETLKAIKAAITALPAPAQIFEGLLLTVNSPLTRVTLEGAATKLTLKQGEAKDVILSVVTSKRQPIDLSAVNTFFLAAKLSKNDTTYVFSKADADFDKSLVASGIVSVFLTAMDTDLAPGIYYGELKMTYAGSPVEIEKSADIIIEIVQAVTT